jgi:hypothetical protein
MVNQNLPFHFLPNQSIKHFFDIHPIGNRIGFGFIMVDNSSKICFDLFVEIDQVIGMVSDVFLVGKKITCHNQLAVSQKRKDGFKFKSNEKGIDKNQNQVDQAKSYQCN